NRKAQRAKRIRQKLRFLSSLNHLIRPRQHFDWDCQTNLFCCLEINDKLKLCSLLYRQFSRFSTFQYLVHVNSSAAEQIWIIGTIGHKTALFDKLPLWINSWQPVFAGKLDNPLSFGEKTGTRLSHNRIDLFLLRGLKGAV